ncbi:MAG TPA: RHS repeat-associated core domain-containing protein [Flavobacteriales bacterium]|nr:RHS repeat-associated core domain-containing protein [Flavobacteriales bacterium]
MAGSFRAVGRDAAGRITGFTHTNNGSAVTSLNQTFGYDELNRLVQVTQATGTTTYTYDANGNRTAITVNGTTYTNIISATSNQLTQVQDAQGTATVAHDAAGNVTGVGTATYTYSDRGRMEAANAGAGTISFAYNGLEQRALKRTQTGERHYIYDEQGQLLGEYDSDGNPVHETIYLDTTPVGVIKQTGTAGSNSIAVSVYNVYADHLYTARIITNQSQQTVWRWDTAEAFGASAPDDNPSGLGPFTFNQRFPGQVFDAETGLNQNWNREYDAGVGRYRQFDPIGLRGGLNGFLYVDGNPLSLVDLDGLAPGDKNFGINDPDFWKWWEREKYKGGWFTDSEPGFNPKKPFDIPNQQCADAVKQEYDSQKGAQRGSGPRPGKSRGNPRVRGGGRGWE